MSYTPNKRKALTGSLRNQKYDLLRATAVLMDLSVHFAHYFGANFSVMCSDLLSIILISIISYNLIEKVWVSFGSRKLKFDYIGGDL